MNVPHLMIVTLNCKGLRDDVKRRKIFYFFHTLLADIICLQETGVKPAEAWHWTDLWTGPAVWTEHAGILLARSHSFQTHSSHHEDRIILAEVSVRGHTFQVLNMYAHADATQCLRFFEKLEDEPV